MRITSMKIDIQPHGDERVMVSTAATETVCDSASPSYGPVGVKLTLENRSNVRLSVTKPGEVAQAVRRARQYGESATVQTKVIDR